MVQKLDYSNQNDQLYEALKARGYQLPVASKQTILELPGRAERIEVALSHVLVDVSSFYCLAQIFLTNYRSGLSHAHFQSRVIPPLVEYTSSHVLYLLSPAVVDLYWELATSHGSWLCHH